MKTTKSLKMLSVIGSRPWAFVVCAAMLGLTIPPTIAAPLQCANRVTFNYTGDIQTYTVPNGVYSITIEALGAEGGNGLSKVGLLNTGGTGGLGGNATGVLAVTPGQTLNILVGGRGSTFNGGGLGGRGESSNAGIGGGASDVRVGGTDLADRVIVAGGGGGGGGAGCTNLTAGAGGGGGGGGGVSGGKGVDSTTSNGVAGGGTGGTISGGGTAGLGCAGFLGVVGTVPDGGAGQSCCCSALNNIPDGGGGGGGYVQGGGGGGGSAGTVGCSGNDKGAGGGGAGGSSYIGGVSSGTTANGVNMGDGSVTLCPEGIVACPETPSSSCLTPGAAQLTIISNADNRKNKISWSWSKGAAVTLNDIGDPASNTDYFFCVYDNAALNFATQVTAGGLCSGKPCWKVSGSNISFKDKDGTSDGINQITLKPAETGKSSVSVSGSKELLPDVTLPWSAPLTAQLINSNEKCWTSEFAAEGVTQDPVKGKLVGKYKQP